MSSTIDRACRLPAPDRTPCPATDQSAELEVRNDLMALAWGPAPLVLDDLQCLALLCELNDDAAEGLLSAFGSLPELLAAPTADLARVAGARAAVRLRLVQVLAARALERPLRSRAVLGSYGQVCDYLRLLMAGAPREQFWALFLDRKNQLIASELLHEGTVDHAPVYPREVMRRALELHASGLVVAHNHPSGDPSPSQADIAVTQELVTAGRALRIAVHDHILVAGRRTVSFKTLGLM